MRVVPIESVREGSYLAKTIYDNDGRVLLREGIQLTQIMIRRIRNLQIFSIYINDEYSSSIIEDIIKPELRQKAIKTIKDTFSSLEKYTLTSKKPEPPSRQREALKERQKYFETISQVADTILDEVLSQKNTLINVVDIKSMDNYTYQHSVNVAILSLIIGIQLQLNKNELYTLCMGSLLHDIGKVFIPKEIIQKQDKLTPYEFDLIKGHSLKGYEYLKKSYDITAPTRIIVLQHHEKVNGQGYPEQREGSEIHKLSKIVSIADVYDALTSDRPYRRAMCPNEAVEYIMAGSGTMFDFETVKAFSRAVVPYPQGTLVRLSNNDLAIVEAPHPIFPLRPKLKIVHSDFKEYIGNIVDLSSDLNLVITSIEYDFPA